ncbi:MAG: hypothetical protein QOI52_402, partial [Chloroflexota bacterium]|nr:hypothetical protein [Chloroflexota bacterium]
MAVAAWGVGLLAVIGGAIAGGHSGGDAAPSAAVATAADLRSPDTAEATDTGRFGDDTSIPVVVLETPNEANAVITTRGIEVRGRVREGGGPVVAMLESSTAERLIVVTVYPVRLPDSGGSAPTSAFIGTLPIPDPRPIGPAFVRILGFDASGTAAHVVVRPIRIGALLDPTYGDGSERPPTGEDGLMGGITSGTNFAWRA